MDIITAANRESGLLESLQAQQVSDLYTYRLTANAPNGSKNVVAVSTSDSLAVGNNISFNLPKFGLLERAVLVTDFTTNSQETVWANIADIGARMFSDITLRAHSNIICSANPQYNLIRQRTSPIETALTLSSIQMPTLVATGAQISFTTGNQVGRVCTPLWLPFFEKPTNYLDLDFCEQLQVNATINTAVQMAGFTQNPTINNVRLFCFFRVLSNEARRAYQAKNFNPERPLNMLIYDQYTESTLCTATTQHSITFKVPHAVFATHAYIGATSCAGYSSGFPIGFSYSMSGRTLFESIPNSVMRYDQSFYGCAGVNVATVGTIAYNGNYTTATQQPLSIFWGESSDRTWNSHAVAMSNVNNPILTVQSSVAQSATTDTLHCVHEYYKLLSISPDDGRLTVGFSI